VVSGSAGAGFKPCEECRVNEAVLDTYCPSCGTKSLCIDCIVAHIAQIAEQAGRPLGP
jgi:hypothetical protein